jgi:hypothetical protein
VRDVQARWATSQKLRSFSRQAGRAAVDRGRVAAGLDEVGVVGQLERAVVVGTERLVGGGVDAAAAVGEEPAEVASGLPHPVRVVLDEQYASVDPNRCSPGA